MLSEEKHHFFSFFFKRQRKIPADDVGHMCSISSGENMLVSWEPSFVTAKKNQSPLGLYRNPPTVFFINPCYVLLIRDQCFVFLSPLPFCIRHHVHLRPTSSGGTPLSRERTYDSLKLRRARNCVYITQIVFVWKSIYLEWLEGE